MLISNMARSFSYGKIGKAREIKGKAMKKISSGMRINKASDDAAGISISESFKAQVRGMAQAGNNIQNGISLLQVADGAMQDIEENIHRMKELAVESSNGTLTDGDRNLIDIEFQQLKDNIKSILDDTEFNDIKIFQHDKKITIQTSENPIEFYDIKLKKIDSNVLDLKNVNIKSQEKAKSSLKNIDNALYKISGELNNVGSFTNDLKHSLSNTTNSNSNLTASLSRITDIDMAASVMHMVKSDILSKYNEFMYSMSKKDMESVKKFI